MKCTLNGQTTTVTWRQFGPACNNLLAIGKVCSLLKGAYLPAITVCQQRLF